MVAVEDITVAGETIAAKGETVMHEIKKSGQNGMIVDTGTTIMVGARSMRGVCMVQGVALTLRKRCITDRMMNLYYITPPSTPALLWSVRLTHPHVFVHALHFVVPPLYPVREPQEEGQESR